MDDDYNKLTMAIDHTNNMVVITAPSLIEYLEGKYKEDVFTKPSEILTDIKDIMSEFQNDKMGLGMSSDAKMFNPGLKEHKGDLDYND